MKTVILLFYKYVELPHPEQIRVWQQELCRNLGLLGRIIIATEGINATVSGTREATDTYKAALSAHPYFSEIDFKEAEGDGSEFPRLRVVVKREIVRLDQDPEKIKACNGGKHLSPEQAHSMIAQNKNLIILDGRNAYESRVGAFKNAIKPAIDNFRDLPRFLDENKELFRDKEVLMYCTGGIRCERASAYLKEKNVAREVYQIEGGIHRYIEQFPDGFFRGKNYVFDGRVSVQANDDICTTCDLCPTPYDEYSNCLNAKCNKQIIVCPACKPTADNCCSKSCLEQVNQGTVVIRTKPKKTSKIAQCSI